MVSGTASPSHEESIAITFGSRFNMLEHVLIAKVVQLLRNVF